MDKTPRLSSAEYSQEVKPDTVGTQQLRTRDKIFRAIGTTVDVGIDTTEFVAETAGYTIGRTINGVRRIAKAISDGNQGKTYRHAV